MVSRIPDVGVPTSDMHVDRFPSSIIGSLCALIIGFSRDSFDTTLSAPGLLSDRPGETLLESVKSK